MRRLLRFNSKPNGPFIAFAQKSFLCYKPRIVVHQKNCIDESNKTAIVDALSLSANSKSLIHGTQLHARIIKVGSSNEIFLQNNLIKLYLKSEALSDGYQLFDTMPDRNLVSWTLIISGAVQNGEYELAFLTYLGMLRNGLTPNEFALASIIKLCTIMEEAHEMGLCTHCLALKIALEKNPFVGCSIIHMYANYGAIEAAELVFESVGSHDLGCWNAMIAGYAQCGYGLQAMGAVSLMQSRGICMDKFTFISALNGCSVTGNLDFGKQIHALITKHVMTEPTSATNNALMDMYFKTNENNLALNLFDTMQEKDIVSWNTVLTGSSSCLNAREVSRFFHDFMMSGLNPSRITFCSLFRLCGELINLDLGLQFHCLTFHFGFHSESNVMDSLISMFSKCGATNLAKSIFGSLHFKTINNWNEMISGYNSNSEPKAALQIFTNLLKSGSKANECTYSTALKACFKTLNLQMGKQIHAVLFKSGFAHDNYMCSLLIKCYIGFGHYSEAIKFFKLLKENGEQPDEFVLGSILNACASLSLHQVTKSVHTLVFKTGFDSNVFVSSAAIDAYAKSGDILSAKTVFLYQSCESVDVVLYNTMIMAYAHHGFVSEAMEMFDKMKVMGLNPSQATFVSIISACSHMGLVEMGRNLFRSMSLDYGMEPSADNYGCLVDLLSRNGCIEEAKDVIKGMPFGCWPGVLRSLINGCWVYGEREVGEWAAIKLLQLVPDDDSAYVLLSKVYSEFGRWGDAAMVRKAMVERGLPKELGCSWVEI